MGPSRLYLGLLVDVTSSRQAAPRGLFLVNLGVRKMSQFYWSNLGAR